MYSYIIKFISLDGLTRFEERSSEKRPEDYIERRTIVAPLSARAAAEPFQPSYRYMRRIYRLSGQGLHPETGKYIYEYKEEL